MKICDKDPEYFDVKMSVEEIWQVLRALFGDSRCECPESDIVRWANAVGGLPYHLLEITEGKK